MKEKVQRIPANQLPVEMEDPRIMASAVETGKLRIDDPTIGVPLVPDVSQKVRMP